MDTKKVTFDMTPKVLAVSPVTKPREKSKERMETRSGKMSKVGPSYKVKATSARSHRQGTDVVITHTTVIASTSSGPPEAVRVNTRRRKRIQHPPEILEDIQNDGVDLNNNDIPEQKSDSKKPVTPKGIQSENSPHPKIESPPPPRLISPPQERSSKPKKPSKQKEDVPVKKLEEEKRNSYCLRSKGPPKFKGQL